MPHVVIRLPDGSARVLEVPMGRSVMEVAVQALLPGIQGECGGSLNCATCLVHVDPEWFERLPPAGEMERELLDAIDGVEPTSRLSCQINLSSSLDGLPVRLPGA